MKVSMFPQGKDGWSKWERPAFASKGVFNYQHLRILCCDCGLSHDHEFFSEEGDIWHRLRVNKRSTAAARREARKAKP